MARSALDDADIPSVVLDEHLVTVQWLYSTAIGGVKVKVAERDVVRAKAVLDRHDEAALGAVPESRLPPASGDTCPECGADTVRGSRLFRSTLAVSLWTNIPLYLWRQRWICESCGHAWKAEALPHRTQAPETLEAERLVQDPPQNYPGVLAFLVALAILIVGVAIQRSYAD